MIPIERPLRPEERELLDFLLSADFPGRDELRKQAATARVTGECECGCGTIHFCVQNEATRAKVEKIVPVEAHADALEVLLFARDGMLSSLEIVFYTNPPQRPYPRPDQLKLWVRPNPQSKHTRPL